MFVVADEAATRVGAERGLAGAAQAEEERRVAVRPLVRRAVHGHHALLGEVVVHHGEHRLLELAGIACAADQNHPLLEVQHDEGVALRAVLLGRRLELGRVQDREVRLEAVELGVRGADEHVPHERGVPRVGRHIAGAQAVLRVGAAVQVLHEQVVQSVQVGRHVREQRVEVCFADGLVHVPPVHVRFARRLADDELVLGRAPRERLGDADERAHVGEAALAARHGRLDQLRGMVVPVQRSGRRESLRAERGCGVRGVRGVLIGLVVGLGGGRHRVWSWARRARESRSGAGSWRRVRARAVLLVGCVPAHP